MKVSSKYVYFTRFLPTGDGDGGCHRVAQILQVFANMGLELISSRAGIAEEKASIGARAFNILKSRSRALNLLEKHFVTDGEYRLWHRDHRKRLYHFRLISCHWARSLENPENIRLAIVDDPLYFAPLTRKLKKCGIRIIAMCHNLESLSHGQVTEEGQRILFNKEVDILSLCDMVTVISREEAVLLNNLGIDTVFFPYYPPDVLVGRLLDIRQRRKQTAKNDIILLGTVGNEPTKHGMVRAIKAWVDHDLARICGKLFVAGYGTESLKGISDSNDVEFLGSLTNKDLDGILSNVKACLCYQEKGTGALTRIPEMLVAGVPVVANTHAVRSYYNSKGVIEFCCFDELEEAIKRAELVDGDIPIPDPPDLSILVSRVRKFM